MFFEIFANIFWRWIENTLVKLKIHFVWCSMRYLWCCEAPDISSLRLCVQHARNLACSSSICECACVWVCLCWCVLCVRFYVYIIWRGFRFQLRFFFLLCFTWLINIDPDWMMESLRKLKWACEPGGEPGRVRMRILTDAIVWILRAQVLKFAWQLLNQIKSNEYLG